MASFWVFMLDFPPKKHAPKKTTPPGVKRTPTVKEPRFLGDPGDTAGRNASGAHRPRGAVVGYSCWQFLGAVVGVPSFFGEKDEEGDEKDEIFRRSRLIFCFEEKDVAPNGR